MAKGCTFQKHSLWKIYNKQLFALQSNYDKAGGFERMNDIVQRTMIDENGLKKQCIDTKYLTSQHMLQFPISGCEAPDGYDSPYNFCESEDGQEWGFAQRIITQEMQTKPNNNTGKVEKWTGDWHKLQIDYHREKKLKIQMVKMPR